MDKKVQQLPQKKQELVFSENSNVNKNGFFGPTAYEPLSHQHARQQTFEVAKTWETQDQKQRGPLRHSLEASPSQGILGAVDKNITSKKQKYLQQNGFINDYKGSPEYSSHITEGLKDKNNKQLQAQQQIKSGRIGIFGNYLAQRISSTQQQKFLLEKASEEAKILEKCLGSNQSNTQRLRPTQDGSDNKIVKEGHRNFQSHHTSDQPQGSLEQNKPIILNRLQNHYQLQESRHSHSRKRESVIGGIRKSVLASGDPKSIDAQRLPPVLQDMKYVQRQMQNTKELLSPMRNSCEGVGNLINSEKMIYSDHLQGASPLLDASNKGHRRSANSSSKQAQYRNNISGLTDDRHQKDKHECEQKIESGQQKLQKSNVLALIPKINVKVTTNGQIYETAESHFYNQDQNAAFLNYVNSTEVTQNTVRNNHQIMKNQNNNKKTQQQIRALSQTQHQPNEIQLSKEQQDAAGLRRSYDQSQAHNPEQIEHGILQSLRTQDNFKMQRPAEGMNNADTLRSSITKSKDQKELEEIHRRNMERQWDKQYSVKNNKDLQMKMISPRASTNINSIAGNQLHQALNLPSQFAGSSNTGNTFGMMPQFFAENQIGQSLVSVPHVNLNLSYGIPFQSLSQGQVQIVHPDHAQKPHNGQNDKTPVWLSKQGVHQKVDEFVLRELLQQSNAQKRYSQQSNTTNTKESSDNHQKSVRLKQANNHSNLSSSRQIHGLANSASRSNMLDYKDYNFIVGKKGGQQSHRYATQQIHAERQQNKGNMERQDYRITSQSGRKGSVLLRLAEQEQQRERESSVARIYHTGHRSGDEHRSQHLMLDKYTTPRQIPARHPNDNTQPIGSRRLANIANKRNQSKAGQRLAVGPKIQQKDDLGQLYHVTIKIHEDLESRINTPNANQPPSRTKKQALPKAVNPNTNQSQPGYTSVQPQKGSRNPQPKQQTDLKYAAWESLTNIKEQQQKEIQYPSSPTRQYLKQLQESRPRKKFTFSPEPKLIELPEEKRLNAQANFPVIPKKLARRLMGEGRSPSNLSDDNRDAMNQQDAGEWFAQEASDSPLIPNLRGSPNASPFRNARIPLDPNQNRIAHEQRLEAQREEQREQNRQYTIQGKCPYAQERANKKAYIKFAKGLENGEDSETEKARKAEEQKQKEEEKQAKEERQKELLRNFLSKFPPKRIPNCHEILEEERRQFMQARKEANRKYTEISANSNKPGKFKHLQFMIYEGNNSDLIRRVMQSRLAGNQQQLGISESETNTTLASKRENPDIHQQAQQAQNYFTWEETTATHLFNFKWKPFSNGLTYDRLSKYGYKQLLNHVEGHQALTTKDQLFFNIKAYCEKKQINVYDVIPLTFAVDFQEDSSQIKFEQITQVLHLFEKNSQLSYTDLNVKLQDLQQQHDRVIRTSYCIGPSEHQHKNLWLLKPTGLNRGIGIHVFNSFEDLQQILWTHYRINVFEKVIKQQTKDIGANGKNQDLIHVSEKALEMMEDGEQNTKPGPTGQTGPRESTRQQKTRQQEVKEITNHSFIIQKYIEAPLLFKGRKFDIRIWALISHDQSLYLFKEAYVRTSSETYDLSDQKLDQVYVHLTNNAVQKYSKNYGQHEEGNIVSMDDLCVELQSDPYNSGQTTEGIKADLYQQMKKQIIMSYEAVKEKLKFHKHTFELVGYDFMVIPSHGGTDAKSCFQTRLIEANTNPCLEESNALLKEYLPRMADDMLKVILDPLFGTQGINLEKKNSANGEQEKVQISYPVEGYEDNENMWTQIVQ